MRSVLEPTPQPLWPGLLASLTGHGCLTVVFLLSTLIMAQCGPRKPIIDLSKQMEVSMVVLPRSKTDLPDRASRIAAPRGSKTPTAKPTPKPVRESDLAIHREDAQPDEGYDAQAADDLMEQLKMQELLDNLEAPEGATNQYATDPNSTTDEAINAIGPGTQGDPEWMRYQRQLERLFKNNFQPLQKDQALECLVHITVDTSSGRVTDYRVIQASGNGSFDALAESAAATVTQVPLPPAKFLPLLSEGFTVRYVPPP